MKKLCYHYPILSIITESLSFAVFYLMHIKIKT